MKNILKIEDLEYSNVDKICFNHFSREIANTAKIAIIGNNGCGKSSLLKLLAHKLTSSSGSIVSDDNLTIGYIPQILIPTNNLSGGEYLINQIKQQLSKLPDLLLLDEPTNHLDANNRYWLFQQLKFYLNALIIVTHDEELLQTINFDEIWHINNGKITITKSNYDDYIFEQILLYEATVNKIEQINKDKKNYNQKVQTLQQKQAKNKKQGIKAKKNSKWAPIIANAKAQSSENAYGKKLNNLANRKEELNNKLKELYLPKKLELNFDFLSTKSFSKDLINISNGSISYKDGPIVLDKIYIHVDGQTKLLIKGNNGSGKTSLIRAILKDEKILREGHWVLPPQKEIAYLDQFYSNLDLTKTVLENMEFDDFSSRQLRSYLHDFLFNTNEDVNKSARLLSGGERVRLSLAKIILQNPSILILDEITNNLDIETKVHITQLVNSFKNALIIISHDERFVSQIGITDIFSIENIKTQI